MGSATPLYGIGIVLVLAGFGALHRWLRGITGPRADAPGGALGAAAVAFLVGSSVLGAAILVDSEQVRTENSRVFVYEVSVVPNATATVTLRLPAPGDPRVHRALSATNGSSSLRYIPADDGPSGTDAAVEIVATGAVRFVVEVRFIGSTLNRTIVGSIPSQPPSTGSRAAAASVELLEPSPGAVGAQVNLTMRYTEYCATTRFTLGADVTEGLGSYAAAWSVVSTALCVPAP